MAVRRDVFVRLKVAARERAAWKHAADAAGVTLSDLIRERMATPLVGRAPRVRRLAAPSADPCLLIGVAKLGNNLNQLARWVNTHKGAADAAAVLVTLSAIERDLAQLLPGN